MPRNVRLGFILSFLLICQPAARLSDNQPAITPTRPIVLFDGKDLKHFYTYLQSSKYSDPKGVFRISNGELRISGEEWGALTTRDRFRDYHLLVEWRWGGATFEPRKNSARDSGILIHGSGPDGAAFGCWLESIEAQIIEGGTGDIILVGGQNRPALSSEIRTEPGSSEVYWQPGGTKIRRDQGRYNWYGRDPAWKDVLGYRGPHDVEKPVGEWNRLEVICDGAQIINVLNGVVVNHGTDATHTEGKIQIQSEGAEIIIRRVELRPVDRTLVTSLLTRAREMGRGKPQGARLNKVIELLQVGQPALGIFVSNISTRGAAGLASSKLDFVIIDMEHSPFDASRLEAYLLAMTDKRRILEKQSLQ
ncbi:MAG TPA: DUF1080 domain-containing protein, partial [Acidobacteriota bacterium]|nr:DUF1080 domain-containing protein [Acidobacteriota bacterium]